MADDNDPLCLVFVPALVAILHRAEQIKGEPLSQAQVLAIRDEATCITLPYSVAQTMDAERGYDDIRPEYCWEDWQAVRSSLDFDAD
jgi:hypothetical protein